MIEIQRRSKVSNQVRLFNRMILVLSFLVICSSLSFSQTKGPKKVTDHTSIAQISSSNAEGTGVNFLNPYTNLRDTFFAGLFLGTLNSVSTKFYCIDINTHLARNEDYWDEGTTPSEITYVLNNYFPFKSGYAGELADINKEAAAIQFAIWHFSDNVDLTQILGANDIKNRAIEIVADATANQNNVVPLATLIIIPASQSFVQGTPGTFDVYALDLNGNPIPSLSIALSATIGSLSATSGTTDLNGKFGPITITYNGTGTATIKAQAHVMIPQGTRYVYKAGADLKQKLVLATPASDIKEVTATVNWYTKPTGCDLNGYTTFTQGGWGSPSNSVPGKIRDQYFNTVFTSGLVVGNAGGNYHLTLTSALAVKNYLPDGSTAAAYTQNYNNPTNQISVLSGQLVALKLNVFYNTAGVLGSNTTKLSDLAIASGTFYGKTVSQFLALAEIAIGGGSLNGYTLSQFNDAAKAINENFDSGTHDKGFLTCNVQPCTSTIGDFVWHDKNHNGIQDSGELGMPGVKVELLQGTSVIANATTDANGKYSFSGLLNGGYTVRIAASNFQVGGALYSNTQTKWYASPNNSGSKSTTLNCGDDLTLDFGYYKTCVSLIKTADKSTYNKGDVITYSFVLENCGDIALAGGAHVFDTMLDPNNEIYGISPLNPGQSVTFTKKYTTLDKDCGQLTNTARVEGHPSDNSTMVVDESSVAVSVNCTQEKADIQIEKIVDNPNPNCNDNVTFTIKVTNLGPSAASSVQATDLLPTGLDYVSSIPSQGTYDHTTGLWNIGSLANGAFATLKITAKVDCGQVNNNAGFDLGVAKDYNLFVLGDATQPSSDTQGKVAVGHNASFSNYSIGDQLPGNSGDVLIVGNDLTFTSGAIFNGNVVYGHNTNLPQSGVSISGGTLRKDTEIDFAAAKVYLEGLSTTLSTYTVNGTTTLQWGGLTLSGTDPYLNVFKVNGSDLSSANNFEIDVPNGSAVLVNIDGTNVSWSGGQAVNGTAINNVLYNFYQATNFTIQGIDIRGSILAPFADVNFSSGVQNGQMICKSLTGMGQFNYQMFGGHIPFDKKLTNVAFVTSSSPIDPNPNNNSSSATVTIKSSGNGNGNNGNGTGSGTWQPVYSFGTGAIVYTLIYDGNTIYAGTWGGKIFKSSDAGKTWTLLNAGMNASFIWSLNISGGYVFAATEKGVYKFNGSSWILTSLSGKDVHTLTSKSGIIYAGTWGFGVYMSSDNGTTWTSINNGFGGFLAIQALTMVSNGDLFASSIGGGIFKLTHGTTTWSRVANSYVWTLGSTSTAIFAGTYGDGLYRSLDNGATWTKLSSLNITFVYSISVDASNKIYVSSITSGVQVSSDNGNTWTDLGLSGADISSLMVNPFSNNVYVGTKTGSIYMASESNTATSVSGTVTVPTEFNLAQNYPNPFNPTTTIQFAVPVAGRYSIKVYNILGQEVANLLDNEMNTGIHKVDFDASRLASGMYIYRFSGNNVSITKKMILMK